MKKHFIIACICLMGSASFSSCLKTRAMLRSETDDQATPQPAQIQDVQPQGKYALDEIKGELTRLTGRIEDLEHKSKQPGDTLTKEDLAKLEKRIIELEQAQVQMIEVIKKTQAALPVQEQPELYQKGKAEFAAKHYEESIESLTTYLKVPNTKNTEDALFTRAEAHFILKQYKKAIVDYSKFPEKYVKSKRLPDALFKIGQSFEALGMREDAKGFYQELADKFPKSPHLKKVRTKLK